MNPDDVARNYGEWLDKIQKDGTFEVNIPSVNWDEFQQEIKEQKEEEGGWYAYQVVPDAFLNPNQRRRLEPCLPTKRIDIFFSVSSQSF